MAGLLTSGRTSDELPASPTSWVTHLLNEADAQSGGPALNDPPIAVPAVAAPQAEQLVDKRKLIGLHALTYNVFVSRGPHWNLPDWVDDYQVGKVAPPTYADLKRMAKHWLDRDPAGPPPFAPWRTSVVYYRNGYRAFVNSGTSGEFHLAYDPSAPLPDMSDLVDLDGTSIEGRSPFGKGLSIHDAFEKIVQDEVQRKAPRPRP